MSIIVMTIIIIITSLGHLVSVQLYAIRTSSSPERYRSPCMDGGLEDGSGERPRLEHLIVEEPEHVC